MLVRTALWTYRAAGVACLGLAATNMLGWKVGATAPMMPLATVELESDGGMVSLHGYVGRDATMYTWDGKFERGTPFTLAGKGRSGAMLARNGPRFSFFVGATMHVFVFIGVAFIPEALVQAGRVLRRRGPKPGRCACGYDVRGLPGPACPECGRPLAGAGPIGP